MSNFKKQIFFISYLLIPAFVLAQDSLLLSKPKRDPGMKGDPGSLRHAVKDRLNNNPEKTNARPQVVFEGKKPQAQDQAEHPVTIETYEEPRENPRDQEKLKQELRDLQYENWDLEGENQKLQKETSQAKDKAGENAAAYESLKAKHLRQSQGELEVREKLLGDYQQQSESAANKANALSTLACISLALMFVGWLPGVALWAAGILPHLAVVGVAIAGPLLFLGLAGLFGTLASKAEAKFHALWEKEDEQNAAIDRIKKETGAAEQ